jgi:hypothetical protein
LVHARVVGPLVGGAVDVVVDVVVVDPAEPVEVDAGEVGDEGELLPHAETLTAEATQTTNPSLRSTTMSP